MYLKYGDLVDVVSPSSSPENESQVLQGLEIIKSWGLRPRFQLASISPLGSFPRGFSPRGFHSVPDSLRSSALNKAFFNKSSSAVWMLRGGYGLQKLMPSLDKKYSHHLKKIKTGDGGGASLSSLGPSFSKKLFIGYSDASPLHLYLNGKGQKSLHAPMVCELGSLKPKELEDFKKILFGVKKELVFSHLKLYGKPSVRTLRAKIIGGNLSLISLSLALPWFPSLKNRFLFIEDVNEKDYKLDGMLYQLLYSGKLKGVRAILFGDFSPLKHSHLKKVFQSFSVKSSIPLVFGLPCGHGLRNLPLPFNVRALLSLKGTKAQLKLKLS